MFRIKEICKEKGITLQELARKLGINYQSVHAIMTGNPTVETLQKIAAVLGVPITELFEPPPDTITCPNCGARLTLCKKESDHNPPTEP
jgi:transcriptional regulator with XRE-family HTH domain